MVARAVPDPRRVPHLRQRLHHDQRRERHRGRCRSWPTGTSIGRLEIGLGSAISVLLFLCVIAASAVVAIKLLQGRPGRRRGGRADEHAVDARPSGSGRVITIVVLVYALFPVVVDRRDVVQAAQPSSTIGQFLPDDVDVENYEQILAPAAPRRTCSCPSLRNSIGISLIATVIAVRPGDARRLRDRPARLPGQAAHPARPRSAVVDLPGHLDRHAAVQPVAQDRPLRHLARADHPVPVADPADLDLDPRRRSSARSRGRWSRPRRWTARPRGRRSAR